MQLDTTLNSVLQTSAAFTGVKPLPSEASIIKSLRTYANDQFDVRMVIAGSASNSRAARYGKQESGGYEVRRKDWQEVVQRMKDGSFSRSHWQRNTIYMVLLLLLYVVLTVADMFTVFYRRIFHLPAVTWVG